MTNGSLDSKVSYLSKRLLLFNSLLNKSPFSLSIYSCKYKHTVRKRKQKTNMSLVWQSLAFRNPKANPKLPTKLLSESAKSPDAAAGKTFSLS